MAKEKVLLREEQETMLITLYCKTVGCPYGLFSDEMAWKIVNSIEYDFSKLRVPMGTRVTICIRAKKMDQLVRDFLRRYPEGVVLHLGCGLDTRFNRVDNGKVIWYDLDLPGVMELRRKLIEPAERYQMVTASVTDPTWVELISAKSRPVMVVAEGLMMYLHEAEVKALIRLLRESFPDCELVFDAYSTFTARNVHHNPSLRKTGAQIYWGIDDASVIETWAPKLRLVEEWYFSQTEDISNMPWGFRLRMRLAGAFKAARKAHRVLYFTS
jgi:O-methyltransferase involved in polyketide biosynthesis